MKLIKDKKKFCEMNQPPSGGCVLKLKMLLMNVNLKIPAAFRRLCVETLILSDFMRNFSQPPSGGCVLKRKGLGNSAFIDTQPPSGGCVLKQSDGVFESIGICQPPSGGCVLKRDLRLRPARQSRPAAFRRLCVETRPQSTPSPTSTPAAFRRLCVETLSRIRSRQCYLNQPPSGGCVLKHHG